MDRSELLARAIRAIAQLPAGVAPSRGMLAALRDGWDNNWSANVAYLDEVARRAAAATGPIVECGSGATTLLLSALAAKRGIEVWTLEHSGDWYLGVYAAMAQLRLPPVNICLCPLQDHGEFSWYTLPRSELPRDIALVVCDGPPADTPGGRYGLWPILKRHLAPGAVILLDDTDREPERAILNRWLASSGGTATTTDRYSTLVLPSSFHDLKWYNFPIYTRFYEVFGNKIHESSHKMAMSVGSTVMLERWFLSHPRSVNESYLEHQGCAMRFSVSLLGAGLACFVHALVPGLFERTASQAIERLHGEMVTHRKRREAAPTTTLTRSDAHY